MRVASRRRGPAEKLRRQMIARAKSAGAKKGDELRGSDRSPARRSLAPEQRTCDEGDRRRRGKSPTANREWARAAELAGEVGRDKTR
jgi:hypothetical protein